MFSVRGGHSVPSLPEEAQGGGACLHLSPLFCQVISCYSKDQSCRAYHHFAVVQISLEM